MYCLFVSVFPVTVLSSCTGVTFLFIDFLPPFYCVFICTQGHIIGAGNFFFFLRPVWLPGLSYKYYMAYIDLRSKAYQVTIYARPSDIPFVVVTGRL